MQKMRLVIDDLHVQSFATDRQSPARGTVRAHDAPTDAVECPTADVAYESCWQTCQRACDPGPSADCSVDCWYTLDWNCQSDLDCMYTAGGAARATAHPHPGAFRSPRRAFCRNMSAGRRIIDPPARSPEPSPGDGLLRRVVTGDHSPCGRAGSASALAARLPPSGDAERFSPGPASRVPALRRRARALRGAPASGRRARAGAAGCASHLRGPRRHPAGGGGRCRHAPRRRLAPGAATYELGLFGGLLRAAIDGEPPTPHADPGAADTAFATAASVRVLRTRWSWDGFLADPGKSAPDERDAAWVLRLPASGPLQLRRLDPLPAVLLEACAYPLARQAAVAAVAAATGVEGDPARLAAIVGAQVDELCAAGLLLPSAPTAADHAVEEMLRLLPAEEPQRQAAARGVAGLLARAVRATREDVEAAVRTPPGSYAILQMDRAVGWLGQLLARARLRDAFSAELDGYWAESDVASRAAAILPLVDVLERVVGTGVRAPSLHHLAMSPPPSAAWAIFPPGTPRNAHVAAAEGMLGRLAAAFPQAGLGVTGSVSRERITRRATWTWWWWMRRSGATCSSPPSRKGSARRCSASSPVWMRSGSAGGCWRLAQTWGCWRWCARPWWRATRPAASASCSAWSPGSTASG